MRIVKIKKLTFWVTMPLHIETEIKSFYGYEKTLTIKIRRNKYFWNEWKVLQVDPMPKENKKGGWMWYWGCFNIRYSDW
jgi:hypothetical protein